MFYGEKLSATRQTANLDEQVSVCMTAGGPNTPLGDGVARDLERATSPLTITVAPERTYVNEKQDPTTG